MAMTGETENYRIPMALPTDNYSAMDVNVVAQHVDRKLKDLSDTENADKNELDTRIEDTEIQLESLETQINTAKQTLTELNQAIEAANSTLATINETLENCARLNGINTFSQINYFNEKISARGVWDPNNSNIQDCSIIVQEDVSGDHYPAIGIYSNRFSKQSIIGINSFGDFFVKKGNDELVYPSYKNAHNLFNNIQTIKAAVPANASAGEQNIILLTNERGNNISVGIGFVVGSGNSAGDDWAKIYYDDNGLRRLKVTVKGDATPHILAYKDEVNVVNNLATTAKSTADTALSKANSAQTAASNAQISANNAAAAVAAAAAAAAAENGNWLDFLAEGDGAKDGAYLNNNGNGHFFIFLAALTNYGGTGANAYNKFVFAFVNCLNAYATPEVTTIGDQNSGISIVASMNHPRLSIRLSQGVGANYHWKLYGKMLI